jgi:hypothetical protein
MTVAKVNTINKEEKEPTVIILFSFTAVNLLFHDEEKKKRSRDLCRPVLFLSVSRQRT